jgi:hypothetical protein
MRGMTVGKLVLRSDERALPLGSGARNRLRMLLREHRRPLRFVAVGGLGLLTDQRAPRLAPGQRVFDRNQQAFFS